jgi:TusA-related sulfurtransferase
VFHTEKKRLFLDLEKEAVECGGVVAALLSYMKKLKTGDELLIKAGKDQVDELRESLDLFSRYGLIKIIEKKSEDEIIIEKIK